MIILETRKSPNHYNCYRWETIFLFFIAHRERLLRFEKLLGIIAVVRMGLRFLNRDYHVRGESSEFRTSNVLIERCRSIHCQSSVDAGLIINHLITIRVTG